LAKDGLGPEAGTCVAAYGELGGDAERLADLQRDVERALGRAHAAPGDRQHRAARGGGVGRRELARARAAEEATDEALRADLLERALAFDQDCVQAHERAGHVRGPDGVFRSPLLAACHERRSAMARALEKARQMPMEVQRVEAKDPLLIALCGRDAALGRRARRPRDRERVAGRAPGDRVPRRPARHGLVEWLLRGTLAPVHSSGTFVHLLFKPEYDAYIAAARRRGRAERRRVRRGDAALGHVRQGAPGQRLRKGHAHRQRERPGHPRHRAPDALRLGPRQPARGGERAAGVDRDRPCQLRRALLPRHAHAALRQARGA
jgi:hypothetical protein